MADEPVEGELFRLNYLRPAVPLKDSGRARERLAAIYESFNFPDRLFAELVRAKLGIQVPSGYNGYVPVLFWREAEIADVLSAITFCFRLNQGGEKYRLAVDQVLREEALRYRIGPKGSIHPFVDEEFERNVATALNGLTAARHGNAIGPFEKALEELAGTNPSGKEIIRDIYEAVESLYLQVVPGSDRITESSIKKSLTPLLVDAYPEWANAADGVERTVASFQAWVKSAHPYRHGTPMEDLHEAPLDYAVLLLSQGASFMRWLLKLDAAAPGPATRFAETPTRL